MDNAILRKRLQTFKSGKGKLTKVGNDVVMEVLRAWENWPGTSADLYRDLDLSKMQLVTMIQKAKKLVKSGTVTESEFKELTIDGPVGRVSTPLQANNSCIEVAWGQDRVIRFCAVEQLVEFLKKAS